MCPIPIIHKRQVSFLIALFFSLTSYKQGSKGTGRNTSWMCSTCEVPLCVKCLIGEENDIMMTHHGRWHTKRDLVAENEICFEAIVSRRVESGKRKAESISLEPEGEALPEVDVDGEHLATEI